MKEYLTVLLKNPLFASIAQPEIQSLLTCLGAEQIEISKDGFALMAGDTPNYIGIVLEGKLQISREDADGNRALLDTLFPGDFFGETLVCAGVRQSPVSILAVTPSKVLKLDFRRLLTVCPNSCGFHSTIIRNMVGVIARKNLLLQGRMEILDQKTIRERLFVYLLRYQERHGEPFTVPLNRSELADYLAVDRSALSRELGRLQEEGVIQYHKNSFSFL
ncbi:MAG: Crp/Fnr family transcriptional regulator [Evtepia sp.]|jgi:CRP-like cAMP-binding protein|nr:Crp/Fnr family transcriptional regulator [Evtepia sp.]